MKINSDISMVYILYLHSKKIYSFIVCPIHVNNILIRIYLFALLLFYLHIRATIFNA